MATSSVRRVVEVEGNGVMGQVELNEEGHLFCTSPVHEAIEWGHCDHKTAVITKGLDKSLFWSPDGYLQVSQVYVPIAPTHGIEVRLDFGEEGPALSRKVHFGQDPEAGEMMGFFEPGEGLSTLRAMVIDFCEGRLDPTAQCSSRAHQFSDQQKWERHTKTPHVFRVELLCVYLYKLCISCNQRLNGANDDDLVPDMERGRR